VRKVHTASCSHLDHPATHALQETSAMLGDVAAIETGAGLEVHTRKRGRGMSLAVVMPCLP
jgi:hypothetical protein